MHIKFNITSAKSVSNVAETQELAVLPASLAKQLLTQHVNAMASASNRDIIKSLMTRLELCAANHDITQAMNECLSWVAERELIQNVKSEHWDAYLSEDKKD